MANLFSPDWNFFRSRNFLSIENFLAAENFLSIENFFINGQLLFIDPEFHHRSRMHFLIGVSTGQQPFSIVRVFVCFC